MRTDAPQAPRAGVESGEGASMVCTNVIVIVCFIVINVSRQSGSRFRYVMMKMNPWIIV